MSLFYIIFLFIIKQSYCFDVRRKSPGWQFAFVFREHYDSHKKINTIHFYFKI